MSLIKNIKCFFDRALDNLMQGLQVNLKEALGAAGREYARMLMMRLVKAMKWPLVALGS